MLVLLFFILSLAALLAATYTDFRERIIPDRLTYGLIVAGLGLQFYSAFAAQDFWIAITAIVVTAATFAGSYGLWRLGVWAGGDVKLMTGLAALNPFNLGVLRDVFGLKFALLSSVAIPVFPLTLFIFSVFAMLPYGALISIAGLRRDAEARREMAAEAKKISRSLLEFSAAIVGLNAIAALAGLQGAAGFAAIIIALIAFGFLKGMAKPVAGAGLFIAALWLGAVSAIGNFFLVFLPLLAVYLLIRLYMTSKSRFLRRKIKVTELEEGMIPAETLVEQDGRILRAESFSIARIIKHFRNNNVQAVLGMLSPKGRIVVSSRRAAGATLEQVVELKKLVEEGRLENEILVSLSAPFVPAILIGYLALQLVGDLLWNLLF